ncbi:MAG: GNAT family N-acetyltransferase [Mailhella sp.]|nr:GNAT family N-acetyltransferase [Mailhella sp.]
MFQTMTANETDFPQEVCAWWDRLALSCEQGDPFCCGSAWQLAYHETMGGPGRRVCVRAESCSLLILTETITASGTTVLTPLESGWLYGTQMLGADAVRLLAEMLPEIRSEYGTIPDIALGGISPSSEAAHDLFRYFSDEYDFFRIGSALPCAASLSGGLDGFLSRRSGNFRAKLKKTLRKAQERGISVADPAPGTDTEADAVFERILSIEARSWKGLSNNGMNEEPYRSFYGALLRRLVRTGQARVLFARADDADIGYIFGGMLGPHYRGQQFSFDAKWKAYSVGNLLQTEQISRLCESGNCFLYHMGSKSGDKMLYKNHWTELTFPMETWLMRIKSES